MAAKQQKNVWKYMFWFLKTIFHAPYTYNNIILSKQASLNNRIKKIKRHNKINWLIEISILQSTITSILILVNDLLWQTKHQKTNKFDQHPNIAIVISHEHIYHLDIDHQHLLPQNLEEITMERPISIYKRTALIS